MKRRNTLKRFVAFSVAFLMIASGGYFIKSEGSTVEAVDTSTQQDVVSVDPGMLTVKVQSGKNATDTIHALRFVTSVNSLKYKDVGFVIEWKEGTELQSIKWSTPDGYVYERIQARDENSYMSYEYSPKVVDTSSSYFATGMLNVTGKESTLYTVTAYVVTLTDETIYGASRCVCYNDGLATAYTNMSFVSETFYEVNETEPITIEGVTSSASNDTYTATVIGCEASKNLDGTNNVHVRVNNVDPTSLPSATKFTFGQNGSVIYRNLLTKHGSTSVATTTTAHADTSWYDTYIQDNLNEKEFVIATTADLYGFVDLVKTAEDIDRNTFKGLKVYLCADLTVNANTPANPEKVASWSNYTPQYNWIPIGGANDTIDIVDFEGTFDGQGHTISGLYTSGVSRAGLFDCTDIGCVVRNIDLKNSYFKGTGSADAGAGVGSIATRGGGTFENIESSAAISPANRGGGLLGYMSKTVQMSHCEFSGEIKSGGFVCGGIVGNLTGSSEAKFVDCTFSGKISSPGNAVGGFIGRVINYSGTLSIANCLSSGTMETAADNIGGFIGHAQNCPNMNMESSRFSGNVYATSTTAGGFVGYVKKTSLNIKKCATTGSITSKHTCGGFIGKSETGTNETTSINLEDCISTANTITTDQSTATAGQLNGGFVGSLTTGNTTSLTSTFNTTRCVMAGKVEGKTNRAIAPIAGRVNYSAKYSGSDVYVLEDNIFSDTAGTYIKCSTITGVSTSGWLSGDNIGWIGKENAGHYTLTRSEMIGQNAFDKMPALEAVIDDNGNNVWVTTETFPMLRIFAE